MRAIYASLSARHLWQDLERVELFERAELLSRVEESSFFEERAVGVKSTRRVEVLVSLT